MILNSFELNLTEQKIKKIQANGYMLNAIHFSIYVVANRKL